MTGQQRRGRGRQPILTAEAIADAALALVAESSAEALTMQAVAARLGVRHAALYRHVSGRGDLLRVVADRIVEQLDWPDPDDATDWRAFLTTAWSTLDDACARYPGAADVVFSSVWPPPRRSIEGGLHIAGALVARWGFPQPLAMLAVDLVLDFTVDARRRVDRILDASPDWDGFADALDGDDALRGAFEEHLEPGPREWTMEKLGVILDGIGKRLDSI